MLSTQDMLSIRDPIRNTPMIPEYLYASSYPTTTTASQFGKKTRKTSYYRKHINSMAKKLGVKISKKSLVKLWSDIIKKGKTVLKYNCKNCKNCKHNKKGCKLCLQSKYLKKHIKQMAKKNKIKQKGKSFIQIWNQINTKMKSKLKTTRRRRTRRTRQTSRTRFGSWWDNTQQDYCNGTQCASANTLGGPYSFYRPNDSNWTPYYKLRGSS